MKTYHVKSFRDEVIWEQVNALQIQDYPWYEDGLKQNTSVKVALTSDAIHLHVVADDIHSSADVLESNGSVHLDSCFEFFFRPEGVENDHYINLEINCIGTVYLAVRNDKGKRRADIHEIAKIKVIPSLEPGVAKSQSVLDESWQLSIMIPLSFVEDFYGKLDLDLWYVNFYRCGGAIDDQYAVWNPVVTKVPDFHQPRQFGKLMFESKC